MNKDWKSNSPSYGFLWIIGDRRYIRYSIEELSEIPTINIIMI